MTATEKRCSRCKILQDAEQFGTSERTADGRRSWCLDCENERAAPGKTYRETARLRINDLYAKLKASVIAHLGGKCPCGFADMRALHVDHAHNGGAKDRKRFASNVAYWRHVLKSPPGFYQLLCANCNAIKEWERRKGR